MVEIDASTKEARRCARRNTDRKNLAEHSSIMIEEYLTIAELAARLKVKPKTIKNKMASGVFRKGVHYFSPDGMGPRFKWSAVVAWLEEKELEEVKPNPINDGIRMAKGYYLGSNHLTGKTSFPS